MTKLFCCCAGDESRDGPGRGSGKHLPRPPQAGPKQKKAVGTSIKEGIISPKDKVVSFQITLDQTTKPKKDYFLGFVFPGNCVEIHKEIKKIFDEEMEKSCKASTTFKACFQNCAIGALFRNEKKLGANIFKTKL